MWLDVITIGFGVISFMLAIVWTIYFCRSKKKIGLSVAWMTFGEAFSSAMTVAFAVMHSMGVLEDVPREVQHLLRISMFTIVMLSTMHLSASVRKIHHDDENK